MDNKEVKCAHVYDFNEPEPQCWECGRPQNAIHAAQEHINTVDQQLYGNTRLCLQEGRDIIEWLLDDLDRGKHAG